MPEHFRTLLDLGPEGLWAVLRRAQELKANRATHDMPLRRRSVVVILEKASTRTRVSFEVGISELGAQPITLIAKDTHLGRGEPLADTGRMLSGYAHGVVYRTFGHDRIEELAAAATIPVINGLSDLYHPCQLLADLLTMEEHGGIEGRSVAWVGDGNNMANSWILASGLLGFELRLACPEGFDPHPPALDAARGRGASVSVVRDPKAACRGAGVVTTDVWASMGQEEEAREREMAFAGYQVTEALMESAASDAIFLHCLPAHRGEEVAAAVIDGPRSRVWDEAENRLHAQKALLWELMA
ncbi:MAG: ornithine carbamoyltransferase [Myxococcota bacterium]